ncbi:hypothetical protein [Yersinia hibernica]|uniref:hypothetical protein n=1 Tax=Yersinia hibernica TaxID=2339259 RepID=UPI0005DCD3A9|nr:hypothetical protein [Yersinia hibernica]OVZ96431.1 hypothetical protein CBW53_15310 [Yersinia frederiksenii]CNJ00638.1 Uncharacterised protein [Yersinia frederiksenii]
MIVDYPDWFPLAQKANKNQVTDTGFRTDQPQVGAPIFQKLTDDLKTTWSVTWILTIEQNRAFTQWLRSPNYLDGCNRWFRMPINLGGVEVQMQELHFTAYPQMNMNGNIITWTGNVITRGMFNSDDEFDDILIELPAPWGSWLDIIVTETLPRSE